MISQRLPRFHILLGRQVRIALLPVLYFLEVSSIFDGCHNATRSHQLLRLFCRLPCGRSQIKCSSCGTTLYSLAQLSNVLRVNLYAVSFAWRLRGLHRSLNACADRPERLCKGPYLCPVHLVEGFIRHR